MYLDFRSKYESPFFSPVVDEGEEPDLLTDLVAYWEMNGGPDFTDSHTNNLDLFSNAGVTTGAGVDGEHAALFSHTLSQYLDGPAASNFITTGPYSLAFWVNMPSVIANSNLAHCLNAADGGEGSWLIYVASGVISFANWRSTSGTGNLVYTISPVITINTWYHIAVVWDGTVTKIYVNGVEQSVSSDGNSGGGWTPGFALGRTYAGATYYYSGRIDKFGYWTKALNEEEIAVLAIPESVYPWN